MAQESITVCVVERTIPHTAIRCPACRELGASEPCSACRTPHHAACLAAEGCAILGCEEQGRPTAWSLEPGALERDRVTGPLWLDADTRTVRVLRYPQGVVSSVRMDETTPEALEAWVQERQADLERLAELSEEEDDYELEMIRDDLERSLSELPHPAEPEAWWGDYALDSLMWGAREGLSLADIAREGVEEAASADHALLLEQREAEEWLRERLTDRLADLRDESRIALAEIREAREEGDAESEEAAVSDLREAREEAALLGRVL